MDPMGYDSQSFRYYPNRSKTSPSLWLKHHPHPWLPGGFKRSVANSSGPTWSSLVTERSLSSDLLSLRVTQENLSSPPQKKVPPLFSENPRKSALVTSWDQRKSHNLRGRSCVNNNRMVIVTIMSGFKQKHKNDNKQPTTTTTNMQSGLLLVIYRVITPYKWSYSHTCNW